MLKFCTVFVLISTTLIACTPAAKNEVPVIAPKCLISQSQCFVETEFGKFEVLFNRDKIVIEVPFAIYLKLGHFTETGKEYEISQVKAYMEGKDMFMGKIPLFFDLAKKSNVMVADTLLGSCSAEQMVWRVWFEVTVASINNANNKESQQKTFFIDFTSSRL